MTDHASRGLLAGRATRVTRFAVAQATTVRAGIHPGGMLMKHMAGRAIRTAMSEG